MVAIYPVPTVRLEDDLGSDFSLVDSSGYLAAMPHLQASLVVI